LLAAMRTILRMCPPEWRYSAMGRRSLCRDLDDGD
jgi:hypothetical protein